MSEGHNSPPADPGRSIDLRAPLWAAAAAVVVLFLGPAFVGAFRPGPDVYADFVQEWLSARNYWNGEPAYLPQRQAFLRETGIDAPRFDTELHWNAHPPAAVAVALPFGLFSDYRTAHLVWNLVTFPLFLAGVVLVLRELAVPWHWWSVFPATALVVASQPLGCQLFQGQLNTLLFLLFAVMWVADRRGCAVWAGTALGLATALKLYPGFLGVYFLLTGRWRVLVAAAVAFLAANAAALAVLGLDDFRTYVQKVVPSLMNYQTSWRNVSLTGFWLRLFDPQAHEKVLPLVSNPVVGKAALLASRLLVVAAVGWAAWRARTPERRDRAFAVAVVGMVLVTPVAWTHYFILLAIPVGLLWMRLPAGPERWLMWAIFATLWLPEYAFAWLAVGKPQALAMINLEHDPVGPAVSLTALSAFTYSLLILFALTLRLPTAPTGTPGEAERA